MMEVANPWMAVLLLPVAIAAWRLLRRGRNSGIKFSAIHRIALNKKTWREHISGLTPFFFIASLVMLTIASMRPRTPLAKESRSVDAIAIAMTVDVSGSMDALDLTEKGEKFSRESTRLAVVKKLFAEFVKRRPDDLIGLITFGGYAATLSPLTADHEALLNVLNGVKIPNSDDEKLTAIGDGLATALARLKDSPLKSKVVILLSDGVSNVGAVEPDEAANAAAKLGIKVYVIGVGTRSKNTPFFGRDFFGNETVIYADTTFDEKQLRSIAEKTNGLYFPVNDKKSLADALEDIDKLETTKIEAISYDRYQEHFIAFLLPGAILFLLATTLSMASSRRLA